MGMDANAQSIINANRVMNFGVQHFDESLESEITQMVTRKTRMEKVDVAFMPSIIFESFGESWFKQIGRVFRGSNAFNRPKLTGDFAQDELLFMKYLENIFIRKLAEIHKGMRKKEPKLYDLIEAMRDLPPRTPYLFANSVACMGTVVIHSKQITLTPVISKHYDWKSRVMSYDEYILVNDWLKELSSWGFQTLESFNFSVEGQYEFMMMSLSEEIIAEAENTDGTSVRNIFEDKGEKGMIIVSEKPCANIIALFRMFFINERIRYITDSRMIYEYPGCNESERMIEHILTKMVYDDQIPQYLQQESALNRTTTNSANVEKPLTYAEEDANALDPK